MTGEDVESPEAREHLELLVGILDREGLLEEVLKRDPEALSQLFEHACRPQWRLVNAERYPGTRATCKSAGLDVELYSLGKVMPR
jgi:hypothetical protein